MISFEEFEKYVKGKESPNFNDKKEGKPYDPPTSTNGFDSLVSEEEYQAVIKLTQAMDNLLAIHNEQFLKQSLDSGISEGRYPELQYLIFNDCIGEARDRISCMYTIHTCDKKMLDEMAKTNSETIPEMFTRILTMQLLDRLSNI